MKVQLRSTLIMLIAVCTATSAVADSTFKSDTDAVKRGFKAPDYSPYAGKQQTKRVATGRHANTVPQASRLPFELATVRARPRRDVS